ncbi:MAG: CPBP family intramembrane metalloprotease [Candidatus Marinimicrobia bacterium]|nr:CPBP family intramembrane metalloprotease [Candidatus Neomarinimicrobiota bacterium]
MNTRLQSKDFLLILICLLAIAGAGYFELSNYHRAFPEHAIDFQVNRKEARNIALDFLAKMDIDPGPKIHASAFEFDNTAKTFVEKEVGLEDADDLLTNHFRIWQWTNRWFEPLNREEILVGVTPKGEVTQFLHKIPEEVAADLLSIDEARRLSHQFLTAIVRINPDEWEFIEDRTEVKPNRVDYRFTYKNKSVEIYDATYRFDVMIQGNKIGEYREYLHVPENWQRSYQRLRSLNATTATTADVFFIILMIVIATFFIIYLGRKQVNIKTSATFGLLTFVLKFLSELNLLPLYKFHLDINQSIGAFYSDFFINLFIQSLLLGLIITVLTGAGELIYARSYPNRIPLARLFSRKGLQTKHTFFSISLGITLAIVFMAFQTIFYLTAKRFGAWAPANISYSDTLNTAFPWILILIGGFLPAVLEEFSFRLFAIPFIEKLLKSKILAVLIPAVIWGFAHANYPNQPFWIRGFEVSVFGIIIGFIFLKFGILTVLVWHYMVDAIYSSMLLLRTGEPYHVISASIALGIILIPLLYNIIMYLKNRGFADSEPLLSAFSPPLKPEPKEPEKACHLYVTAYQKLTPRRLKTILILILIFTAVLWIPFEKIGDYYKYSIPRSEIKQTATDFLRDKGVDPDNFKNTMVLINNYSNLNGRYILENSTVKNFNSILARHLNNSVVWRVRFYRPLEKEEYNIYIHPGEKSVVGFDHLLPESAEAFSIDKDAACFRAKEFLSSRNLRLSDFELVEDYSRQLPNRIEHTFIWEAKDLHPANVGDGTLRFKTIVTGDAVSSFTIFYKIPEEWEHAKTRKTLFDSLRLAIQIAVLCLIAFVSFMVLTRQMKSVTIEWKTPLMISILLGGGWLILELANYPLALINYNTSWGIQVWTVFWVLITLLRILVITLIIFLLTTLVLSIYPKCLTTLKRDCRYHFSRDAVFSAILISVGIYAIQHLSYRLAFNVAPAVIQPDFQMPHSINYILAPLYAILSIVSRGFILAAVAGVGIFWIRKIIPRQSIQYIIVALSLAVFIPDSYDTIREYIVLYISYAAIIVWLWIAIVCFLRNNIPAYLYSGLIFTAVKFSENLIASRTPRSYAGALSVLCIVTILLIWLLTEKKDVKLGDWIRQTAKRIMINK